MGQAVPKLAAPAVDLRQPPFGSPTHKNLNGGKYNDYYSLSDELKNSDSYKQEAADVVNLCCEALVKLHQKCCISIRFVMQTIHNLQRFADIVPSIRGLDRHYDAFFPVDNADCSFLTDFDSIAEGLEAAKNDSDNYLAMVGSNSPLSRLAALKDILKSEDYVAAVSNLLFADQEVAPYAGMKKMILCLSMEETDEATALLLDTYCTVTSTTLCQLTIIKLDSGSLLQRKKAIRMLKMYCATI